MRLKFDEQLQQLHAELMRMGSMIETGIAGAVKAFLEQDTALAKQIMEEDEAVDHQQKKIENICFNLLIQQQPVARDLRTITAAMKMVTDMERIGDQAADISELTIEMSGKPYPIDEKDIKKMASEAIQMLLHALESYVERNMGKAEEVITHDEIVDALFLTVKNELIDIIRNHAENAEAAADLLMVIKYLERIGDHATNIAEWVIFSLSSSPIEWQSFCSCP